MNNKINRYLLVFGILFVSLFSICSCSSTYHSRAINDDDIYYSKNDQSVEGNEVQTEINTADQTEEKATGNEPTDDPYYDAEERRRQQRREDHRRREINAAILWEVGYFLLDTIAITILLF